MDGKRIISVKAIQLTTEKNFEFRANLFADTTGDAIIAHMAGADIMVGMEGRDVFKEPSAPSASSNHTMGNTLMFKAYDTGKPVKFHKPFWAYSYTEEDLEYREHSDISAGYWWIELGGLQDTIEDFEEIRDELLKVLYGVWDHIKNSGNHDAETWDLEWVQFLPGKRESRRVKGDYILTEQDLVEGRYFADAVAYGGWPIDTHTPSGITGSAENPNHFQNLDNLYSIPFRCLYARDLENLMIGGRAVSASHLAFASLRVMGTTSVIGQAIGTAASLLIKDGLNPRQLYTTGKIKKLQQILLRDDCYIPGVSNTDPNDLAKKANLAASSSQDGYPLEHLLTGISRPVGNDNNLWCSAENDQSPWLRLTWQNPVKISEVILKFDSDLNHDLMISLDKGVIEEWRNTPPPSLVRAFRIDFELNGKIIKTRTVKESCIRNAVEKFESPIKCDSLKISLLETYGMKQFRLFEIRVMPAQ